ncbi:MAG: 16S rRNA (guanine(527)-N(7))-methyltransferase RsmG [Actinomycetota bacterium]|nr:16S rRNA (guanine(527)-N(7))-methyltransferase RsmG [Actinomycetota bacterium]
MFHVKRPAEADGGAAAEAMFGDRYPLAQRYVELLAGPGVHRGLIGPGEVDRLWERHMLNSAVLGELLPEGCRVLDMGSGAGLPGIPLALARPDLVLFLLDTMARRVAWLQEVVAELGLAISVHRGRAEDPRVRDELGGKDVVTARAVAPLGRLASWALPLVQPGGRLLAIKGATACEEAVRDAHAVQAAGGGPVEIVQCGATIVRPPTTVIIVPRRAQRVTRTARARRRKDR